MQILELQQRSWEKRWRQRVIRTEWKKSKIRRKKWIITVNPCGGCCCQLHPTGETKEITERSSNSEVYRFLLAPFPMIIKTIDHESARSNCLHAVARRYLFHKEDLSFIWCVCVCRSFTALVKKKTPQTAETYKSQNPSKLLTNDVEITPELLVGVVSNKQRGETAEQQQALMEKKNVYPSAVGFTCL